MLFNLNKNIEVLNNTSSVLSALLHNVSEDWTTNNEGDNTWTVKEVVAHLIVCEETDWLTRAKVILSDGPDKTFMPIDMKAHFEVAQNNSLQQLLKRFSELRTEGLEELKGYQLKEDELLKTAKHPVLGFVTLQQLLAAWATHDLAHIAQIARVMAKQNTESVGNFKQFLRILN